MGLLMRRRRPVMRLAAGAATATVAYQAGKRSDRGAMNDGTPATYGAPQQPPAGAAPAPGGPADTTAQLAQLAQMHTSGALSDTEFAAAKSKLLGV
jgi:hypothetical protein